ncbi:hypothetical protein PIB30_012073 [Stylosanthes scabra]|uniref:TauD/TfdA-like domain-containing protein n=1 Tax=Stylosanthes scabra TaxID=79078 RepID=A0ABU6Q601_9FABA|nr:hypothetical protein [Stylosanthes scabra]
MVVSSEAFVEIEVPQQKVYDGVRFPAVVAPSAPTTGSLTECIKANREYLDTLIQERGAVLFRGFPLQNPSDFNHVVESFEWEEFPYHGGAAPRTNVIGRVFTANESPPEQNIHFHHEMALYPEYPGKLFFYCDVAPEKGGETPIVLSHVVYDRMKEKHPEFIERIEKHGLFYTRYTQEEDDPTPIGRGWKSTFATNDKKVAEERAAKLKIKLEWLENGMVKETIGPVPGVKYVKSTQKSIWFNHSMGWDDPKKPVMFADGEALPLDAAKDALRMLEEESVDLPWKKGDFLLIDNLAVLHGRRACNTPRRVLAALVK